VDAVERRSLQELLVRLSRGDPTAFEPAFTKLWPLLRAVCVRLLGSADGEDAAQSALLKIFARADELDPERDAVSWAVGVALWECKTLQKRDRRGRFDRSPSAKHRVAALSSVDQDPEQLAEERELRAALEAGLRDLRPSDAEVLRMLLRGGSPEIPSATFRKRVQRAVARLRELWRQRHGTE
jgi:RNA polymerase sigma factor (sigma-70 family)